MEDAVLWAVAIGFIAGNVSGYIRSGSIIVDYAIGIILMIIALAIAEGILVKSWLTITL